MTTIKTLSPAKLNLTFDIKGLLPDGYHEVETLLQAIDLHDTITFDIVESKESSIDIASTNSHDAGTFPLNSTNLIAKAAESFLSHMAKSAAIKAVVEKRIPIGAGLAGGSSNAAATLLALNDAFGKPLSQQQLNDVGSAIGADVPFCLSGGTAIGVGRGDQLTPIEVTTPLIFCVIKHRHLSVSTPWAYKKYDEFKGETIHPQAQKAAAALHEGDLQATVAAFGNCFEPVIFAHHAELIELKKQLLALGCLCSHLSGSGPAVYAVVQDREMAHFVERKLLNMDNHGLDVFIAESISTGVQII